MLTGGISIILICGPVDYGGYGGRNIGRLTYNIYTNILTNIYLNIGRLTSQIILDFPKAGLKLLSVYFNTTKLSD